MRNADREAALQTIWNHLQDCREATQFLYRERMISYEEYFKLWFAICEPEQEVINIQKG